MPKYRNPGRVRNRSQAVVPVAFDKDGIKIVLIPPNYKTTRKIDVDWVFINEMGFPFSGANTLHIGGSGGFCDVYDCGTGVRYDPPRILGIVPNARPENKRFAGRAEMVLPCEAEQLGWIRPMKRKHPRASKQPDLPWWGNGTPPGALEIDTSGRVVQH